MGWARWVLVAGAVLQLAACAVLPRTAPVPAAQQGEMTVLGLNDIYYWGDEVTPQMLAEARATYRREVAYAAGQGVKTLPPAYYLAISGGGEDGAFGAGLLVGWSAAGTRPSFKAVTGISTGALIAPFAFLGPGYDAQLEQVYTQLQPHDILEKRWLLRGLLGDALATNAPLARLLQRYITPQMLQAIAVQYEHGRLLLIATTDLDAGRPVIWNIGKIAASGRPGAGALVRKILLASAAIPVAFPPVMIDVRADGKQYQEMNVDGGASAQVFLYPPGLKLKQMAGARRRRLYVIRNARLDPQWAAVNRRTLSIAGRATSVVIQNQGIGDLYRIYGIARRDDVDFNLASIPPDFNQPLRYAFDPAYMKALFARGYQMGKAGHEWAKVPPGFGEEGP